jgi:hypothetical protein
MILLKTHRQFVLNRLNVSHDEKKQKRFSTEDGINVSRKRYNSLFMCPVVKTKSNSKTTM